jgi:hypothetical protein
VAHQDVAAADDGAELLHVAVDGLGGRCCQSVWAVIGGLYNIIVANTCKKF